MKLKVEFKGDDNAVISIGGEAIARYAGYHTLLVILHSVSKARQVDMPKPPEPCPICKGKGCELCYKGLPAKRYKVWLSGEDDITFDSYWNALKHLVQSTIHRRPCYDEGIRAMRNDSVLGGITAIFEDIEIDLNEQDLPF